MGYCILFLFIVLVKLIIHLIITFVEIVVSESIAVLKMRLQKYALFLKIFFSGGFNFVLDINLILSFFLMLN
ncbi:hypothetical protein BZG01_13040 [Labilibaculum manganireducens]|uniref:Uncharacterized protein n=1 Tax=Labilibaculum manganireducens TaxID=1940525 RepID=A0A2N3I4Z1_9BACT|nr:hypothetical protein BZG01_13040 [Labilibaculum manganireducens]